MKLVLDNGQEIELEARLAEGHVITDVLVGFTSISFESESKQEGIGWAKSHDQTMATVLGLASYLEGVANDYVYEE